jgi:hypothetical protein
MLDQSHLPHRRLDALRFERVRDEQPNGRVWLQSLLTSSNVRTREKLAHRRKEKWMMGQSGGSPLRSWQGIGIKGVLRALLPGAHPLWYVQQNGRSREAYSS